MQENLKELWLRAGYFWELADEFKSAADLYGRGAKKVECRELHEKCLEAASQTKHADEIAAQSFYYLVAEGDLETLFPKLIEAQKGLDDDHPSVFRALSAKVVLYLVRHDVKKADAAFLEAINKNSKYTSSIQAKVADDLLTACRSRDAEALNAALQPRNLANLDFNVARLCKNIKLPPAEDDSSTIAPSGDDNDDLPDLT